MSAPLRLGIAGLGYMGNLHLQKALTHPDIQVVALYDNDAGKRERLQQEGLPVARSFEELLEKAEAVIIASPTHTHFAYAEKALRAQRHLLIEKPVAPTLAELEKLIFLREEAGVVAVAGHVERFNPAFQALLPYRSQLHLFGFERIAPWTPRGTDASVVMDLLIHDLDLFWALTEGHKVEVRASAYRVRTLNADSIQAWIDLADGRVAYFTVSRVAPHKRRRLTAHGPDLWAEADLLQRTLSMWRLSPTHEPIPLSVEIPAADPLYLQLEQFLHAIRTGRSSPLSLEHVHSVMAWAQQVENLSGRQLAFAPEL